MTTRETHEAVGQLSAKGAITTFQLPTPKPGPEQLLVRVLWAAGTAVTVWILDFGITEPQFPFVIGESLVGEVVSVGQDVDLQPGDKVLSFTFTDDAQGKSTQEYTLLSKWSVGKLPDNITPQEAAAIPDNLVTAYYVLFDQLGLPVPPTLPVTTAPEGKSEPILVWGGGGSVGQYAVQLLHLAGYENIFAVASSRHHPYLRSLGANLVFDYSEADVVGRIVAAAGGPIKFAFDTIGDEENSLKPTSKVVGEGSKLAYLLPVRVGGYGSVQGLKGTTDVELPGVKLVPIAARFYQNNEKLKRELQPKIIPDLLERGLIRPNRVKEVQGESLLERVSKAVDLLRRGEVSGERLVFRVSQN